VEKRRRAASTRCGEEKQGKKKEQRQTEQRRRDEGLLLDQVHQDSLAVLEQLNAYFEDPGIDWLDRVAPPRESAVPQLGTKTVLQTKDRGT